MLGLVTTCLCLLGINLIIAVDYIIDGGKRRDKGKLCRWIIKRFGPWGLAKFWGCFMTPLALLGVGMWIAGVDKGTRLMPVLAYWSIVSCMKVDDLINGTDDDRWKKRWSSLKNKVQWKMKLPVLVPVPVRGTA